MDKTIRKRDDFDILPIGQLYESPLNPRKTYTEKGMGELTESIRTKGIQMPLLVRPNNGRFEIAAGHRRYRAALRLKLTEVPALIRDLNDNDFLELITIENLQREDIHPLDEAQGYQTLIEKTGLDVQAVAAKIGKSISYVYQRLKLIELIPEAQGAFASEKITAGHAVLIARLQPNEQKQVLIEIGKGRWSGDEIMPTRELADYIETNIHLDLNSVSFSKKDPALVPETGPCTTCPNRTGSQPELFPDIKKKDMCTVPDCFHRKIEAHIAQWFQKKSQDTDVPPLRLSGDYDYRNKKLPENSKDPIPANLWNEITDRKKKTCEYIREGMIIEGRSKGRILHVCIEPKCKVHHGSAYDSAENQKWKAQQKTESEKRKQEKTFRLRILDATVVKIPNELSKEDLVFLAVQFLDELWDEYKKEFVKRHGIEPIKKQYSRDYLKPAEKYFKTLDRWALQKILMEMALIWNLERRSFGGKISDHLKEMAKRYKIDIKAMEAQFQKELKEKNQTKKVQALAKKAQTPIRKEKAHGSRVKKTH
jgi:ParB family chromosome partitioning protein